MKKKLILLSLLLLTIGMVSAFTHISVKNNLVIGGGYNSTPDGKTGPLAGVANTILSANFTHGYVIQELESLGYSDAKSCIDNKGKYELKCLEGSGNEISGLTYTQCLSQGECHFDNDYLNTLNFHYSPCRAYCHSDEPFATTPHEIGAMNGGTNTLLTECNQLDTSADRAEFFDELWDSDNNRYDIIDLSPYTTYSFNAYSSEDMCIWKGSWSTSSTSGKSNLYINEIYLDAKYRSGWAKYLTSPYDNSTNNRYNSLSYKEKCELFSTSGDSTTFNFPAGSGSPIQYAINSNNLKFHDFERTTFTQYDGERISTNTIETECHENPIDISLDTYLRDYPDLIFEEGIWPKSATITLDASESSPEGVSYHWTGDLGMAWLDDRFSFIEIRPTLGQRNLNLELTTFDGVWTHNFPINLTIEDMFHANVQTSLSGTTVTPGSPFTFVISGFTFDGIALESFTFDPGQRELGNGQFIDVVGEFQCKESTYVQCLIDDAVYEGIPRIGNACGCPITMNGAGTVYLGEKEGSKDDDAYKRKFDGDEFEYSFSMQYPTKTSCGPDRVCQAVLEVTDVNGRTAEKIIELTLPGVQSCPGIYDKSILGTNSTQFVGYINDGEQSCQCKFGYSPELDDTLSLALGKPTNVCISNIIVDDDEEITAPSNSNPTYDRQQDRDYSEHSSSNPFETEESGSSLKILLILILAMLMGIFGFEFYRKKKTGDYFNPFKKSPTSAAGPSESISQSPIEKFISDAKKSGENPATIKQNLKNSGWPEDEINKYI